MEYKDNYKVLGLERNATQDEVKRTYRKLARKFHPDINKDPTAEAQFKEIGDAYEVLGHAEKRAAYDQLGNQWKQGQEFRPPPNWDAGFEFSGATSEGAGAQFSDFFDTLFGAMRRGEPGHRRHAEVHARGEDHHAKILIDLRDALEGATRTITLRAPDIDATGHVAVQDRTLNVSIPKGITDGQHIRLKGQGDPGIGEGGVGDLYLEVRLKKDVLYRVSGKDLYLDLPLAPWEAALGASVRVPTPQGPIMLKIPAGSSQGRELRVKGRGIPAAEPGDLYAVLKIVLPPANTDSARKVYEDMARELAFDPRAKFGVQIMADKTLPMISPEIIHPGAMYTLDELYQSCNVEVDWVVQLVEQGVIEPVGQARSDWQFASISIVRVAKARRLGRDLDLSPSGLALVLDELDELRSRLRSLETMPDRLEEQRKSLEREFLIGRVCLKVVAMALDCDAGSGEVNFCQALALAESRGMRPLVAHCRLGLGKLYRRSGKHWRRKST